MHGSTSKVMMVDMDQQYLNCQINFCSSASSVLSTGHGPTLACEPYSNERCSSWNLFTFLTYLNGNHDCWEGSWSGALGGATLDDGLLHSTSFCFYYLTSHLSPLSPRLMLNKRRVDRDFMPALGLLHASRILSLPQAVTTKK